MEKDIVCVVASNKPTMPTYIVEDIEARVSVEDLTKLLGGLDISFGIEKLAGAAEAGYNMHVRVSNRSVFIMPPPGHKLIGVAFGENSKVIKPRHTLFARFKDVMSSVYEVDPALFGISKWELYFGRTSLGRFAKQKAIAHGANNDIGPVTIWIYSCYVEDKW